MRRFYVDKINVDDFVKIEKKDFFHLKNVLRLKEGEDIVCFCGDGFDYICKIKSINKNHAVCQFIEAIKSQKHSNIELTLFQGVTKSDKLEIIVQKMTELGVKKIVFFKSQYSSRKDYEFRPEKLKNVCIEACKQCGRSDLIDIIGLKSFNEMINEVSEYSQIVFAYERAEKQILNLNPRQKTAVVIGSEGGFSQEEAGKLCDLCATKCVSLGKRILRSETASMILIGIVQSKLEEWL